MAVFLRRHGIAFFSMRKTASTSVKEALRALCADDPGDYLDTFGDPISARHRRLARGLFKFTIVRDPVERFLSGYGNRVVHHKDLTRRGIDRFLVGAAGLDPEPDIDTFIARFGAYRLVNDKIRRHARLQCRYLRGDLSYFDAVYPITEMDRLARDLSRRTGRAVTIARLQTGGPKIRFRDLRAESQHRLLDLTAPDYAFLSAYFAPPRPV